MVNAQLDALEGIDASNTLSNVEYPTPNPALESTTEAMDRICRQSRLDQNESLMQSLPVFLSRPSAHSSSDAVCQQEYLAGIAADMVDVEPRLADPRRQAKWAAKVT